ncbi:MAG: YebC/PmpR family DNA-binding transcriptional regulator [Deltaproteobacteria bacterium]|nr:YebC/PmpR family DNA-binding transcriptional regulator [Deltaproteobacteria bacterium]
MAGHSKWAQIKRKKAANDQKRGKIFSKLLKEIEIATKLGGPNVDGNARLKNAILKAKSEGVPNDNIQKAIQRASGDKSKENLEELYYEGMGPMNVAFIARVVTDNRNRSASEIRHLVSKAGGSLLGSNSVRHLFKERGVIKIQQTSISEDEILSEVLDFSVDDLKIFDSEAEIVLELQDLVRCVEKLKEKFNVTSAEVKFVPVTTVSVSEEDAEKVLAFFDALDDHEDIQEVFFNAEL